jgi:hypothetical protein
MSRECRRLTVFLGSSAAFDNCHEVAWFNPGSRKLLDGNSGEGDPVPVEYIVHLSPEAERLAEAVAHARERDEPSAFGALGHLPDVLRDALALGLVQIARRHGLGVRNTADETWERLREAVEAGDVPRALEHADRFLADLLRDGPTASWALDREGHFTVAWLVYAILNPEPAPGGPDDGR